MNGIIADTIPRIITQMGEIQCQITNLNLNIRGLQGFGVYPEIQPKSLLTY